MEMNGKKLLEKEIKNYLFIKIAYMCMFLLTHSPTSENLHNDSMMNV